MEQIFPNQFILPQHHLDGKCHELFIKHCASYDCDIKTRTYRVKTGWSAGKPMYLNRTMLVSLAIKPASISSLLISFVKQYGSQCVHSPVVDEWERAQRVKAKPKAKVSTDSLQCKCLVGLRAKVKNKGALVKLTFGGDVPNIVGDVVTLPGRYRSKTNEVVSLGDLAPLFDQLKQHRTSHCFVTAKGRKFSSAAVMSNWLKKRHNAGKS